MKAHCAAFQPAVFTCCVSVVCLWFLLTLFPPLQTQTRQCDGVLVKKLQEA